LDALTAFVTLAHAQLRIQLIKRYRLLEKADMGNPKFQGLASKMALLRHNLDLDAEKLSAGIDEADAKRVVTVTKSTEFLASAHQDLEDVHASIAALDVATNGPPRTQLPKVELNEAGIVK
jgi:hypothetical protein